MRWFNMLLQCIWKTIIHLSPIWATLKAIITGWLQLDYLSISLALLILMLRAAIENVHFRYLENLLRTEKLWTAMSSFSYFLVSVPSMLPSVQRMRQAGEEVDEAAEDEFYLKRLDVGLITLQLIDYIMLEICSSGAPSVCTRSYISVGQAW